MSNVDETPFAHVVIGDVVAAESRLRTEDTQTHRRELIRAIFAAVEGLNWRLKQAVFQSARGFAHLSAHEQAAMLEETYSVDDRGAVSSMPRFLPLASSIRLVVGILQRFRPSYQEDFQHIGWTNLKAAIALRNRLVHPKTVEDLKVSDDEVARALSAFSWMLALALGVMSETKDHYEETSARIVESFRATGKELPPEVARLAEMLKRPWQGSEKTPFASDHSTNTPPPVGA